MAQFNTNQWNGSGTAGATSAERLVYRALRDLLVLRAGQTASPEAMQDGLEMLNDLLDSWNTERLTVYQIARDLYDLVADVAEYPVPQRRIEAAGLVKDGTERELDVLTPAQWAAVSDKSAAGTPRAIYSDNAAGESIVFVHRVPTEAAELALYTWQPLQAFDSLETSYTLPPGYALALRFNLAAVLAPSFGVTHAKANPLLGGIEANAVKYKAAIKSFNIRPIYLSCDPALLAPRAFDIYTGR